MPTTSCRDRAPASSIPLRAHGPPAARICTSATAMRTRCGEGDLVGGWHAGASPFTPITRWVTKGASSSASLAHTYTPLGRSQRLGRQGWLRTKFELEIEFPDGVFFLELVEYSNFAVSRSGASLPRTPPRTFSSTSHLLAPLAPPCRPLAGCEFHDSCPPVCAGSKLNIYPLLPERAAASLAGAGVLHAPMRLVGPRPAHAAHICLRAAGPRATP